MLTQLSKLRWNDILVEQIHYFIHQSVKKIYILKVHYQGSKVITSVEVISFHSAGLTT